MSSEREKKELESYCVGAGLNIGCGPRPIKGAINMDILPDSGADIIVDAAYLPCPSGHYDYVVSSHCLEHVEQAPLLVLMEWLRVLKVGGVLAFIVPDGADGVSSLGESPGTFVEGKHVHVFTVLTLRSLLTYAGATILKLQVVERPEWRTKVIFAVARKNKSVIEYTPDSVRAKLMWLKAVRHNLTPQGALRWFTKGW